MTPYTSTHDPNRRWTVEEYIAEECKRQQRYPEGLNGMRIAWSLITEGRSDPDFDLRDALKGLAHFIEPTKNDPNTYRKVNVRVGDRLCPDWTMVNGLMTEWFDLLPSRTPEENYYELMLIHPWEDGNGRTGKIVYNYLKGTLDNPVFPPNFFGCENP